MSDLHKKLTINEIFFSIQGESWLAGLPCIFVRLTGCHQRCTYCDTEYAFYEGQKMTLAEILAQIEKFDCKNLLLTGGEPLLQENCALLAQILLGKGFRVAIETGGNRKINVLPRAVIKIMDLKTPDSGEEARNDYGNLEFLESKDEVKFVITSSKDLEWSLQKVNDYKLDALCHVSFSPIDRAFLPQMADAILASGRTIRLQTQFHKIVWPAKERGY